jgi:[acyl-carrier-protein] S-malonyltransferase
MEGQLTSWVRWTDSVQWLIDQGVTEFVEIGPKNVLSALIRRVSKTVKTITVTTPAEIKSLTRES